jgi:large subunit ribosomal protein L1
MGKVKIIKIKEELPAVSDQLPDENSSDLSGVKEPDQIQDQQDKKSTSEKPKTGKKVAKIRSKKHQEMAEKVERNKKYSLTEAVKLVKETSYSKFDGSIEAHINTTLKALRGFVTMPFSKGKKLTILAFGDEAKKSGADIIGSDETIEEIVKGKINFDVVITTPFWMPKLAKAAKILGPRGLMPNPKSGTISDNLEKVVTELQGGKTEYKCEANGKVIHLIVGKVSQPDEEIIANVKILLSTIGKSKMDKVTLSSTMGPGVKVDLGSI